MKRLNILGIALCAMCAFYVVSAGSAFAVETAQWLVDGATIALTEKVNVDITGELLYEDMNATLKPDVLCVEILGLEFIYSNGEDELVEWECMKVESMTSGVTCEVPRPVDFPWLTQLIQISGVYFEEYKSDGKGEPGWTVTCTALGVKVTDTCTSENIKSTETNDSATEEVESAFLESTEKAEEVNCAVGGKEEGLIVGIEFLTALNAAGTELLGLEVSLTPEVL